MSPEDYFGLKPLDWSSGLKKCKLIYIGGSMSNRAGVLETSQALRAAGFDVFNEWIMPGEETDTKWQEFAQAQNQTYLEALAAPHARDVFEFDKTWLDKSDAFVLVMPAGKSAHLECGYMIGKGKPALIYMPKEPDRWDVMALFATAIYDNLDDIKEYLKN